MNKIEHKAIQAKTPPRFFIGQRIASNKVAGIVETCFYYKDRWNYVIAGNVGLDRDVPVHEREGTILLGNAYVAEENVKWVHYDGCGWAPVLNKGETHSCQ